jgi:predicted dehydrogenase
MDIRPVRLGILGCGAVADYAIVEPARNSDAITVDAVASRTIERAAAWAKERGIPRFFGSYDELLAAADIDAIYIALPNAMHCEWAIRAMREGFDVLCEKPVALNAGEAQQIAAVVRETGQVFMEALHWRYHPMARRLKEIAASGELGEIRSVDVEFLIPDALVEPDNVRLDFALGGGALMDSGCYCVDLIRLLLGEPLDVVAAEASLGGAQVDLAMKAEMQHAGKGVSRIHCSLMHPGEFAINARIVGTGGSLLVQQPFLPQWGNSLELTKHSGVTHEDATTEPTYDFQLRAFADAVRRRGGILTSIENAIANIRIIDQIYRRAGLLPRGTGA